MINDQLNIYDYLGFSDDLIYKQISSLAVGEKLFLEKIKIRRTTKFYELESEDFHECFKEKESCYQFFLKNNSSF